MRQLFVPSTRDVDVPLTPDQHLVVTERVARAVGATGHTPAHGFWVDEKRGLISEPVNIVHATADPDRVAKLLARTLSQWAVTTRHDHEHRFVKPDGSHESLPHLVEVHTGGEDVSGLKRHMADLFGGGTHVGNVVFSAHNDPKKLVDLYRYVLLNHPTAKVKEVA